MVFSASLQDIRNFSIRIIIDYNYPLSIRKGKWGSVFAYLSYIFALIFGNMQTKDLNEFKLSNIRLHVTIPRTGVIVTNQSYLGLSIFFIHLSLCYIVIFVVAIGDRHLNTFANISLSSFLSVHLSAHLSVRISVCLDEIYLTLKAIF